MPVATPSQSSVDFGAPLVGTPATQTITVTSNGVPDPGGASNLALGAVGVSGAGFAVAGDTCSGQVLPSGQSCAVTMQFVPGGVAAQAGSLVVPSNATGGATTIALAGAGTAPPPPPPVVPVAAAAPAPRFAVAGRKVARGVGLTVTFRVPPGANVVRLAIHRVRRGRTARKGAVGDVPGAPARGRGPDAAGRPHPGAPADARDTSCGYARAAPGATWAR